MRALFGRRKVYDRLKKPLQAYATALCADPDRAEDLVQESLARALAAKRPPTHEEELRPWLFRILRNLFYDEQRKAKVQREYLEHEKRCLDETASIGTPGTIDPAEVLAVRQAYERLSTDHREILALIDMMGLSYTEAAEVLDIAKGTVMSRVSRARRALLAVLEDSEDSNVVPLSRLGKGMRQTHE